MRLGETLVRSRLWRFDDARKIIWLEPSVDRQRRIGDACALAHWRVQEPGQARRMNKLASRREFSGWEPPHYSQTHYSQTLRDDGSRMRRCCARSRLVCSEICGLWRVVPVPPTCRRALCRAREYGSGAARPGTLAATDGDGGLQIRPSARTP